MPSGTLEAHAACGRSPRSAAGSSACCMAPLGLRREILDEIGAVCPAPEQQYTLDSLDHLESLDADDFLTLNLLNNQDMGNVLWKWAFEFLSIDTTNDSEFNERAELAYYVFADDPTVNLAAHTIGPRLNSEGNARTRGQVWRVEGDGRMASPRTRESGAMAYTNVLTMDTVAGSRALQQLQGHSITYRIAMGPQAGRKMLTACAARCKQFQPGKRMIVTLAS